MFKDWRCDLYSYLEMQEEPIYSYTYSFHPMTCCFLCLDELSISYVTSLCISHYILTYSDDKVDIFQGRSWFFIIPKVYNIEFMGHKLKGFIKTSHINLLKDFLEDTINIFLLSRSLLWSQLRMEILFILLGISITQGRYWILFLLLGQDHLSYKSI